MARIKGVMVYNSQKTHSIFPPGVADKKHILTSNSKPHPKIISMDLYVKGAENIIIWTYIMILSHTSGL